MEIDEYQKADKELKFLHDLEKEISEIIYKNFARVA